MNHITTAVKIVGLLILLGFPASPDDYLPIPTPDGFNLTVKRSLLKYRLKLAGSTKDADLGRRRVPGSQYREIQTLGSKVLFDNIYTHDELSRRVTPQSTEPKKSFLMLGGCSFIYGENLNDDQTLPSYLARKLSDTKIYNYGMAGSGPNWLLAKLQQPKFKDEIEESNGTLLYVFFKSHIGRVNGFAQELSWSSADPFFELNEQDELIRRGSFLTGRPWRSWAWLGLQKTLSAWLPRLPWNWPRLSAEHIHTTCRVLEKMGAEFHRHFPQGRFALLNHPLYGQESRLVACLKNRGLEVLDISKPSSLKGFKLPHDEHPTALANQWLAEALGPHLQKSRSAAWVAQRQ